VEVFEPLPVMTVESPQQIKAFTDPLRARVLGVLAARAATNQQVAEELGEPQAKVLYHVRFLVDAGLVRLVDTRIKGGNVEKYYRAEARNFAIRPSPDQYSEVVSTTFDAIAQDVLASYAVWPDQVPVLVARDKRMTAEQVKDFYARFQQFIADEWGGDDERGEPAENSDAHLVAFVFSMFRQPRDPTA
jgi:DNA-binding transcriptional ArsR family regulator